ncbi:MAG TPA: ArsR family transcriptional regulator [Longimicrobiales bacterium]
MNWFDRLAGSTRGRLLWLLRRSENTISGLASELGISDNAVRTHVAALQRDGMVDEAGVLRSTGGKPAQLYRISGAAEELFPKAYALVLGELIRTLEDRVGKEEVIELLREVGARAAAAHRRGDADVEARVAAAAEVLRTLGGDVEVEREEGGWRIRGFACPLSGVVKDHPSVCSLGEALVEQITGRPTRERCERGDHPRCSFCVADAGGAEAVEAVDVAGSGAPGGRPVA